ncbi:MAG: V-type ATP synthase subunit I [Anaerolineaceae bacterium]
MFYPQEMTEIEIIVPAKDLLQVTKTLDGQGIFNQTDVNYLGNEKENNQPNLWQEKAATFSALERRLQSILSALEIQDVNPKNRDFGMLPDVEKTQEQIDAIDLRVKGSVDQITLLVKQIEHLKNLLQQIEPLAEVDVDFSQLRDSKYVYSILGMMPPENIDRLKTSVSRIPFVFHTLSKIQQKAVVWVACSRENSEILNRAARSAYFDPINLPDDQKGTPLEIITSLKNEISEAEKKISELKNTLAQVRKEDESQILSLLWDVRCSRMMTNTIIHYGRLKYTYIIVGWVYSSRLTFLREKIKKVSKDVIIETRQTKREIESGNVPTALNNPRLISPFQMLVTTYAEPKYGELDPTPLVAILFPLLFGAMFGDVGHGLILAVLGAVITSKKVKAFKGLTSLGPIILACGILAILFGFLYGSLFGYEDILHALWMRPSTNIMSILIITIVGGIVVLSLGFLLNIFNGYRSKEWVNTTFGHNGVVSLLLYWSLIGFAGSLLVPNFPISNKIFVISAIITGVGVMFSELIMNLFEGHRPLIEGGIATYAIQIVFELLETFISLLSNSLSFVRVGAFAVAHGNLSTVFFVLAKMVDPNKGIGYWLMFLVGLVFIVGFEGLIVGIQTMRLTYYEIFGKFFRGGGKRFESLSLHPSEND